MKFTPHIGLSSPEDFMFPASAGSNPIDQIKFIADCGFAGIEDNLRKLSTFTSNFKIELRLLTVIVD